MAGRILIVDDEQDIRTLIEIYLHKAGYETVQAADGEEALAIVRQGNIDLVVLDLMMPRMDGMAFCLQLRQQSTIPIIMLSAKAEDMDKIHGLCLGADDYMTKPFNPQELVARVGAQLRRSRMLQQAPPAGKDDVPSQGLWLEVDKHQVFVDGRKVELTRTEFAILELLWHRRGMVFSAEAIYEQVWQEPAYDSTNTVMVHIRNIREKIERDPHEPVYLKNVWGVGYKLD